MARQVDYVAMQQAVAEQRRRAARLAARPIVGLFDNHGDNVIWGGLIRGLKPLLPRIDRAVYALVNDLEARGLLDSTLILMMGEFGRTPTITATGGRVHYVIIQMVQASERKRVAKWFY